MALTSSAVIPTLGSVGCGFLDSAFGWAEPFAATSVALVGKEPSESISHGKFWRTTTPPLPAHLKISADAGAAAKQKGAAIHTSFHIAGVLLRDGRSRR